MPASPQSSGTAGSIVLVEEYGALAVAIGSALKKFAPGFSTRAVRTLAEAESAVGETKPDLLIVDFDPPQPGAFEFFLRLKSIAPGARVLVIAAAPLSTLSAKSAAAGAFQFVEKPFDLKTLGAGIQAVLGSGNGHRSRQTLRDLAVRDVVPLHCLARATAVLKVDAAGGRTGEIHFIDGELSHAETSEVDGPAALEEMLRWRTPRFKVPKRRPRAARTLEGSWTTAFLDAVNRVELMPQSPAEMAPDEPPVKSIGGGKKLVVIDDTEMLLVFVEDSLATADPTLEIVTAATGSEGVERVQTVRPDLVLLDYSLPDFNGDEVCNRLLADPRTANIPVIMMSGHVPEMAASALRCTNIAATIAKPFLSDALIGMVTKALSDPAQFAVRPAPQQTAPLTPAPPPTPSEPARAEPLVEETLRAARNPPKTTVATSTPLPKSVVPPVETAPHQAPPPAAPSPPPPPARPAPPQQPFLPPPAPAPAAASAIKSAVIAPPPPIPVMAPAPKPVVTRMPAHTAVAEPRPVAAPSAQKIVAIAPARLVAAPTNVVLLAVPLEVVAVQFSTRLQMAAIRARPASRTISLHVDAGALGGMSLPEAGFELGPVELDARGQIDAIRLLPTTQRPSAIEPRNAFPVGGVSLLATNGGKAVELRPAAAAPMVMNFSAPFELASVELSPTFGVGALVLKARAGDIRVSLEREGARSGATFATAQVLLNRSAQIAEILLEAVA